MRKKKKSNRSSQSAAKGEAQKLVKLFIDNGVDEVTLDRILDTLIDIGDLNTTAMAIVLDHVKDFLTGKMPEPTENIVINGAVICIMEMVLNARDKSILDRYHKHNNINCK